MKGRKQYRGDIAWLTLVFKLTSTFHKILVHSSGEIFLLFLLGKSWSAFNPSTARCGLNKAVERLERQEPSIVTMPIVNGDSVRHAGPLLSSMPVEDHDIALKILQNEYRNGDGLDIHTLLDSAKHGGLTYNDFLVLPGYIGPLFTAQCLTNSLTSGRISCF